MKNIHVLPTDKPSRLHYWDGILKINNSDIPLGLLYQNIYITSDEEIKEGDWHFKNDKMVTKSHLIDGTCKKIILTTDQDLIKDGLQAIDDNFLEWFVQNPSCEEVEVVKGFADGTNYGFNFLDYKIIIPKKFKNSCDIIFETASLIDEDEPKQETLGLKVSEETVYYQVLIVNNKGEKLAFKQNDKWTINASTEEILDQIFKTI